MRYFFSIMAIGAAMFMGIMSPAVVLAQDSDVDRQLNAFAGEQGAGLSGRNTDPRIAVANIIRIALGFLGVLFISYTVYAGYIIMTAAGNEEKITKGKSTLRTAVIGVLVAMSAYAVTIFVTQSLRIAGGEEDVGEGIRIDESRQRPPNRDPLSNGNPYYRD